MKKSHTILEIPDHALQGPSVWCGKEMRDNPDLWLRNLSSLEIADLESAATHFVRLQKPLREIAKNDFPLQHFDRHLVELQNKLLHGVGVEVLRGLAVDKYASEFLSTIFCGIGAHLGSARSQNSAGDLLGHVRNIGANSNDPNVRIYQTSARQSFHTDSSDVVGLLCIRTAKKGGRSLLVSAASIFNRMRELRPRTATATI